MNSKRLDVRSRKGRIYVTQTTKPTQLSGLIKKEARGILMIPLVPWNIS